MNIPTLTLPVMVVDVFIIIHILPAPGKCCAMSRLLPTSLPTLSHGAGTSHTTLRSRRKSRFTAHLHFTKQSAESE